MEKITKENLNILINEFYKWFKEDQHSSTKNAYVEFRNKDYWTKLTEEELLKIIFEFAMKGGLIQSNGQRTAYRFKDSIKDNLLKFKADTLKIFNEDFDWKKWWSEMPQYKYFGKGIRSIFLHRINPNKYPVLNNKSRDGLVKLGYLEKPAGTSDKLYTQIFDSMETLSKDLNSFREFKDSKTKLYDLDALMHFIIGTENGKKLMDKLSENEAKPDNIISIPQNYILYGPPGTGKTYNTFEIVKNEIFNDEGLQKEDLKNNPNIFFTTFHQTYSYEQFVEGISVLTDKDFPTNVIYEVRDGIFKKASLLAYKLAGFEPAIDSEKNWTMESIGSKEDRKLKFQNADPVVLIIDEINRGNISKILGELITLIEDDKRLGEDNEIIVKLPYSQIQFSVPPNLYIIGTMNTADRSLVQMDTALRRRFVFEEMMPNYDVALWQNPDVLGFKLKDFLEKLNKKITKELDREHQIGHAYLMKVEDVDGLKVAWENKIMPLLQEYFYADYEKLSNVIGTSKYLEKKGDIWELNMKAGEDKFAEEFKKVYKSLTGETIESETVKLDNFSDEIPATPLNLG